MSRHEPLGQDERDVVDLYARRFTIEETFRDRKDPRFGRGLEPNTSKKRSLSLFNQGCYWFEAPPNMREDRVELLMTAFGEIVREHHAIRSALGIL